MLIDTHCHLDALEFAHDRADIVAHAMQQGVSAMVIPAVHARYFTEVIGLSERYPHCHYALGIHPMYVDDSKDADLEVLADCLKTQMQSDNPPIAIGEIGLDLFETKDNLVRQTHFFNQQLKLAQAHDLPVILHVRKAVDPVLKSLRRIPVKGGIAHAFNGSYQQAEQLLQLGFKLGFGGAMTYERALHIRELARQLPLEAIVLETDAPDIPPAWVGNRGRNSPDQLMKIAEVLAEIRGVKIAEILDQTTYNACQVLQKIAHLYTPPKVLL